MIGLGTVDQARLVAFADEGVPAPSLHSPKYFPDPEPSIRSGVKTLVTAALHLLQ